jgi:hypothetical protein
MSSIVLGPRDPDWWARLTPEAFDDWETKDKYEADSWFVIPEFGVQPADVEFEGFSRPILALASPQQAEAIRRLVKDVRLLARREFSTLRELDAEYARWLESPDVAWGTERRRVAVMYRTAIDRLQLRSRDAAVMLDDLLWISSLIATWGVRGAQAAFEESARREQQRRDATHRPRPGALSSIRDRVLAQMKLRRADNVSFKEFLAEWQLDALDGLRLEELAAGEKYRVADENTLTGQIGAGEQVYTFSTLQKMYSESLARPARE